MEERRISQAELERSVHGLHLIVSGEFSKIAQQTSDLRLDFAKGLGGIENRLTALATATAVANGRLGKVELAVADIIAWRGNLKGKIEGVRIGLMLGSGFAGAGLGAALGKLTGWF